MKSATCVCSQAHPGFLVLALLAGVVLGAVQAQNEPILVPEAVEYQKLLPVLPEPPQGWTADKPEGSTEDVGGFRITNVHRDYHKGEGDKAPQRRSAYSIRLLIRIMSLPPPLHGTATAKAAKVTANLSRSMATLDLKRSRTKVSMPLCG